VYGPQTEVLGIAAFYNVSNYPPWFDLLDIYEETKDASYIDAADYAAHFTLAGIRSYPKVGNDLQTIHPHNEFNGNSDIWWKGTVRYKMGHPRKAGDVKEKQVPQWLVSPIGLSLEQPMTFFGNNLNHIYMSSWAPGLLRLNNTGKRTIFETYARNALIGRFANYPGYYASGYSDLSADSAYPYKGPDVTSIYYHHIPPHLAFNIDFLVTETVQRSKGKISFPYGKQQGFVWFNNRIYGGEAGTILKDDKASLWLNKNGINVADERINYLTAISNDRFYIMLMNEADETVNTAVALGKEVAKKTDPKAEYLQDLSAKAQKLQLIDGAINVAIPARGLSLITLPLIDKITDKKETAVKNGFQEIPLDNYACKLYLFRIRSPFGWDSFYGYLSSALPAGTEASLQVTGSDEKLYKNAFPFEWSMHPLPANKELTWKLIIKEKGSAESTELKGTL